MSVWSCTPCHAVVRSLALLGVICAVGTEIPKIIHHVYHAKDLSTGKVPWPFAVYKVSYESMKRHFPASEFEFMFHTDHELEQCVQDQFPEFLDVLRSMGVPERPDAGRCCIMWKYGGIYADLDYEALRNFYHELPAGKVSLLESPFRELRGKAYKDWQVPQLQNALMASPVRHPFWLAAIRRMSHPGPHKWRDPLNGTGPAMMTHLAAERQDDVHVLPCTKFQRTGEKCGDLMDVSLETAGIHWNAWSYQPYNSKRIKQGGPAYELLKHRGELLERLTALRARVDIGSASEASREDVTTKDHNDEM